LTGAVPLLRALPLAAHDAEKNGDCAIAFSASTEKTPSCRQNGKNVRYLAHMRKKRPF
jgi:hypothetical protein